MVERSTKRSEKTLRNRLHRFLWSHSREAEALRSALGLIRKASPDTYIFGGLLRDLMISGCRATPRDVDVVVSSPSIEHLLDVFPARVRRRNRFGGLALSFEGWRLDVWPLKQTWAFRMNYISPAAFESLPRSTFLNIEAAAIEVDLESPETGRVYAAGFFEGIRSRIIEVNLEENPFPDLCIVRSLIFAAKTGYAVGPRLAKYIAVNADRYKIQDLMTVQLQHYGVPRRSDTEYEFWIDRIQWHVSRFPDAPLDFRSAEGTQLALRFGQSE